MQCFNAIIMSTGDIADASLPSGCVICKHCPRHDKRQRLPIGKQLCQRRFEGGRPVGAAAIQRHDAELRRLPCSKTYSWTCTYLLRGPGCKVATAMHCPEGWTWTNSAQKGRCMSESPSVISASQGHCGTWWRGAQLGGDVAGLRQRQLQHQAAAVVRDAAHHIQPPRRPRHHDVVLSARHGALAAVPMLSLNTQHAARLAPAETTWH